MGCVLARPCLRTGTKDEEIGTDSYFKDASVHSEASARGGSVFPSTHGFQSYSSNNSLQQKPTGAIIFTMDELSRGTGNFSPSNKIGQGGFGLVYRGKLRDGRIVAIKRAKKDVFEQRLSVEFRTEVDMLSQVDHLNLVKLIGYMEENSERILVVEYVPNGNLREHLDEQDKEKYNVVKFLLSKPGDAGSYGGVLDMSTRLDIAIDVAHALTYLHLYADRPIIHRDVKSSNILLTETFRAKVADFGFSRVGPATDVGATHVSTQVKGTAGYLDPEYLTTYQLNTKSDVYSFGVLLVEIFTGRRPIEVRRASDERVTVRWAFKKFVEGNVIDILDPKIEKASAAVSVMERIAELAFACSAPTKGDRPNMKKAAEFLWDIRRDYLAAHQKDLNARAVKTGSLNRDRIHNELMASVGVRNKTSINPTYEASLPRGSQRRRNSS